ncbi:unnamed protein product, partial [Discosporangium mesarthrocarpum]
MNSKVWKRRVAAYKEAGQACLLGDGSAADELGVHLPQMLVDKNMQAVEAAVGALAAYFSTPAAQSLPADGGARLCSALVTRAISSSARGPLETKGIEASSALLGGQVGEQAKNGAWAVLAEGAGA